ncbi:MAG TPA: TatD family hydrolase [Solirubrobacterales bacterium]|nr:TatD family hydrolase [Solirubrobacterales bacterium]
MVDTHAHLGMCEQGDGELVAAARDAGIRRILTVGIDPAGNREAVATAEAHEEVLACVGRHPNSAGGFDKGAAAEIEDLAAHPRVRAIGETGLDYYREGAPRDAQRAAFEAQVEVARRTGLPVVIHMRDSVEDTFEVLSSRADGVTVILHCFSASPEGAAQAGERGWYCSFAGNLTYPRAEALREAARVVPPELLLVETDSPFLAPQAHRGRPNQPANVVATAERLAEVRGVSYEELEETVEANAARAFAW